MQHRLTLPPLEVQDFPHVGFADARMPPQSSYIHGSTNQQDIVQEILSVAQASQDFMNQDTWGGHYANNPDDFSFVSPSNHIHEDACSSFKYMDQLREDCNFKSFDIGGMDEDFKTERMVENLRWVGMSDKDLEKVLDINILHILSLFCLIEDCTLNPYNPQSTVLLGGVQDSSN